MQPSNSSDSTCEVDRLLTHYGEITHNPAGQRWQRRLTRNRVDALSLTASRPTAARTTSIVSPARGADPQRPAAGIGLREGVTRSGT